MDPNRFSLCLFDLGKVLIDFDFRIATERLSPLCGLPPGEIFERLASWEGIVAFEEGKVTPSEFFEEVKARLHLPLDYESFLPIWNEIFTENKEVTDVVRRLLGKVPLAMISNTNRLHFDYCYRTFPILKEIGQFILSCDVGFRKPDPRIYQAALARFNIPPQKTIYVDDLEELIRAGKGLGLEAIQFEGAERLKEALSQRGVL